MAIVRPAGASGFHFTGYTHDFYVRHVYGRNVGVRHDNGVMLCRVEIPRPRLGAARRNTTGPCVAIRARQKKPGPEWGPVSVFAGVGAGNNFQRGTSCAPVILGGYAPGATANTQYANVGA
jgi:hypothetical protein